MGLHLTHSRYDGARLEGKGRSIDLIVSSILPWEDKACLQVYSGEFHEYVRSVPVGLDSLISLESIGIEGVELDIRTKEPYRGSGKEVPQIEINYSAPEYKITRIRRTREGRHIITMKNKCKEYNK
ncbi:MAG TPA: hypothetical protein HA282_00505 [Nanoarchaeota archaeon]|nr:hypothetical protein [Candidatus Pacearchaeota archaeon]HIH17740.1 hypothetical protein [Nanoarchaeota archaeon]HIH33804.1 hypothetical protein [Nanoarchaeota archaeon]HIH51617.1 hypothetical protein [Nanoarchaeota archaeon]HIH65682.1 hypothetical protein [Nanoarchaeota archaeon]